MLKCSKLLSSWLRMSLWEQLQSCSEKSTKGSNIEKYSDHEFITCSSCNDLSRIKKYNVITNDWSVLFEYKFDNPYDMNPHITAICMDHDKQRIYATTTATATESFLLVFEISTNTINEYPHNKGYFGEQPVLIMLNGELHWWSFK